MKVTLEAANLSEPEIIIRGDITSWQVQNIVELLNGKQSLQKMFFFKNDTEYLFDVSDVIYFEADNNKTYAHIGNDIYEARHKLYELESIGHSKGFIRINKGIVVNVNYVLSVAAEFSGNYTLILRDSKTQLTISRKYVKDFKQYIMEVY